MISAITSTQTSSFFEPISFKKRNPQKNTAQKANQIAQKQSHENACIRKKQTVEISPLKFTSKTAGQTTYFDFCTFHYWTVGDNPKLRETYFDDLFTQLKSANINHVILAFAQIAKLDNFSAGKIPKTPNDDLFGYIINTYPDVLPSFISKGHEEGMRISLSFGGANAIGPNLPICQGNETANSQVQKLMSFVNHMKLDGVDFDLEGEAQTEFANANKTTMVPFFKRLHTELKKVDKTLTLTVNADVASADHFSALFNSNGNKSPTFTDFFDGLNLMNYDSGERYYIDPKNKDEGGITWGLENWLDIIGKENASALHVGFQDATPYESKNASAGQEYNIDTTDSGKAAAEIYTQVKKEVSKDGYPTNFGEPFWWPDEGKMSNRYEINANTGHGDFQVGVMKNFFESLSQSQTWCEYISELPNRIWHLLV